MHQVADLYGRTFKTLRISLTNTCNLGCVYCVQTDDARREFQEKNTPLSLGQLIQLVSELNKVLPLKTVRFTGGEPTLYKELVPLVKALTHLGVSDIKMTSNGYLLENMAAELAAAGLKEVNISLDAIDADVFYSVSRRKDLHRILNAVERCIQVGLQVKINAVIIKGINDSQIIPLFNYAIQHKITLRFLELMKMGHHFSSGFDRCFYSEKEILNTIAKQFAFVKQPRKAGSTANYWLTEEGYRFGIIANESSPFCSDCDRLRLDNQGNIFGCLSENTAIPLFNVMSDSAAFIERLQLALNQKQAVRFKGSELHMMAIGG